MQAFQSLTMALPLALALGGCVSAQSSYGGAGSSGTGRDQKQPQAGTTAAMDNYGVASPKNAMGPNSRWNATRTTAGSGKGG
jgi:hypothetical protein